MAETAEDQNSSSEDLDDTISYNEAFDETLDNDPLLLPAATASSMQHQNISQEYQPDLTLQSSSTNFTNSRSSSF